MALIRPSRSMPLVGEIVKKVSSIPGLSFIIIHLSDLLPDTDQSLQAGREISLHLTDSIKATRRKPAHSLLITVGLEMSLYFNITELIISLKTLIISRHSRGKILQTNIFTSMKKYQNI
jgi:hypothetical protein